VVLDLRGKSDVTDHFVICHGTSERQVAAIADGIQERLQRSLHRRPSHVEGQRSAEWVLLDYVDFVVHVFVKEKREFYRLERLWGDAESIDLRPWTRGAAERRSGSA
jgi:ribosome-associated protein